jgi:hydrogenase assembly chaperone HypC/HupF
MCIATPVRVTKVAGDMIEIESHGKKLIKSAMLIKGQGVKRGDYVLAHGELAIQKLSERDALQIIRLATELGAHESETHRAHGHPHAHTTRRKTAIGK